MLTPLKNGTTLLCILIIALNKRYNTWESVILNYAAAGAENNFNPPPERP